MTKPRFTFKKTAEVLLIIWVFLITIDAGQTIYAFTYYGSQVIERNLLGYPLGIVFVYCAWFFICSLVEFAPRTASYLCISIMVLMAFSVAAIINNFLVLL